MVLPLFFYFIGYPLHFLCPSSDSFHYPNILCTDAFPSHTCPRQSLILTWTKTVTNLHMPPNLSKLSSYSRSMFLANPFPYVCQAWHIKSRTHQVTLTKACLPQSKARLESNSQTKLGAWPNHGLLFCNFAQVTSSLLVSVSSLVKQKD